MALPQPTNWIDALVEAGDPPHGTQSIRRAFLILRVLSSAGDSGLGLSEIAMATGLARPTAHRFLSALVAEGAVEQRPRTQRYSVAKTLVISALTPSASPLLSAATPHLDEAADDIGDTLFLTLRAGTRYRLRGAAPGQLSDPGAGARRRREAANRFQRLRDRTAGQYVAGRGATHRRAKPPTPPRQWCDGRKRCPRHRNGQKTRLRLSGTRHRAGDARCFHRLR